MFTAPHMGLIVWDDAEDDFDHTQLAANFVAIDNHDHTPGKGKPISAEALETGSITSAQLAEEAVQGKNVQNGAIGAEQIDPEFLPFGAVIQWYRLSSETPLPSGWEICDGREWKTITNKMGYKTGNIPSLIDKFVKGAHAEGGGTAIGDTGGNATVNLAHAHTVESHTHTSPVHTHSVPSHAHTIALDGEHAHAYHGTFPVEGSYNLFQHHVGIPAGEHIGEYTEALRVANLPNQAEEREVPMLPTGAHAHGGSTGSTGGTTGSTGGTTGGTAPNTDSKLSSTSIEPPWVGLLFIMRCR